MREPLGGLSASELRRVDEACDRFEAALRAGQRPAVDDFLGSVAEAARAVLARELRALERAYFRSGPRPAGGETRTHPGLPGVGLPHTLAGSAAPAGAGGEGPSVVVDLPPCTVAGPAAAGGPRRFGDYELLDKLGQGGMGEVFRARQVRANRLVVLKIIRRDRLEDLPPEKRAQWVERFRIEAHTAAQMEHPHIVPVYQVGEVDGQHYYSMRFIPGRSLGELTEAGPLPPARAAAYIEAVARAVHHAHGRGILHRDLKPRNIIVDADDRPYVTDFGLAKWLLGGPSELTAMGTLVGSPPYIAPEQVVDASAVTVAADVYGLGATLYHLLTGRPPFQAGSVHETLRKVREDEPVPPARLVPGLDRDLETICLKCLHKDPRRRYATALELADDLHRYLHYQPVHARRPSVWERGLRHVRRHPAVALLCVLLAVVAAAAPDWPWRLGPGDDRVATPPAVAPPPAPPPAKLPPAAPPVAHRVEVVPTIPLAGPMEEPSFDLITEERREALEQRIAELEAAANRTGGDAAGRREAARAARLAGKIHERLGALAAAEQDYRRAVAALAPPGQVVADVDRRALAAAWHDLGLARARLGRGAEAADALGQACRLGQAQVEADPSRTARTELARTWFALGRVRAALPGQRAGAAAAFAEAWQLQKALADDDAGSSGLRFELALTCNARGTLAWAAGHVDEAGAEFGEAARLAGALVQAEPTAPAYRLELARVEMNRGNVLGHRRHLDEARLPFDHAIQTLKHLHAEYRWHAPTAVELAAARATLGALLRRGAESADAADPAAGRLTAEASELFHQAEAVLDRFADRQPRDVVLRRRLAEVRSTLGGGFVAMNDWAAAEPLLRAAIAGQEELLQCQPPAPDDAHALGLSLQRLARLQLGREQDGIFRAGAWALAVPTRDATTIAAMTWRHAAALRLARDAARRAAGLHGKLRQDDPGRRAYAEQERDADGVGAEACLLLGDHAAAARAAEAMAQVMQGSPQAAEDQYHAARVLSLCVRLARHDAALSEAEQLRVERAYGDRAVALLRAARAGGKDIDAAPDSRAFGALRQRRDFRELFPRVREW